MSNDGEGPRWGDEVWKDDDKVRIISGENFSPWRTWDEASGPWKFPNGLMQFLMDAGFRAPTPIQSFTWPPLMDGKDVIGVAKTGSGKTLGYLLPGYIKVKREEGKGSSCDHKNGPMMLVLAPTRELCQQIYDESVRFGKPAQIGTASVFGGAPKGGQQRQLWSGPQCVVATPGRLKDFLTDGSIKIGQVLYFVLDEADRMLDMGFGPQIQEIAKFLPPERQSALFTATWPKEVRHIAADLTNRAAVHIQVGNSDNTTNADITQHIIKVKNDGDKMRFLETEIFPMLQRTGSSALIFTKTKRATAGLHKTLSQAGAPIVCLHGDMVQADRDNALWAFKNGRAKVLVATDVAQRGLDMKGVNVVVNYDPPNNAEEYIHRIGRTGRAGEKGDAYTCLTDSDRDIAQKIMQVIRKAGQEVPAVLKELVEEQNTHLDGGWGNYRGGKSGGYGGSGW